MNVLDEFIGKKELTYNEIMLILVDFEKRIKTLEEGEKITGVYVQGAPEYVKKYYKQIEEESN